ncbi:unnamed protein product [Pleuronectes platessa]|uniref:Uncharacterized protein n=1 Tax=Pleuronectes platessa TaxID=8262 RepID=A0A9N7VV75_PLEPL|nr:unnamed protein product [Pleuronectes platessa]
MVGVELCARDVLGLSAAALRAREIGTHTHAELEEWLVVVNIKLRQRLDRTGVWPTAVCSCSGDNWLGQAPMPAPTVDESSFVRSFSLRPPPPPALQPGQVHVGCQIQVLLPPCRCECKFKCVSAQWWTGGPYWECAASGIGSSSCTSHEG